MEKIRSLKLKQMLNCLLLLFFTSGWLTLSPMVAVAITTSTTTTTTTTTTGISTTSTTLFISGSIAGDFNNDGLVDLAITDRLNPRIKILMGLNDGGFSSEHDVEAGAPSIYITALQCNPKRKSYPHEHRMNDNLDLVVILADIDSAREGRGDRIGIFEGDGTGGFLGPTVYRVTSHTDGPLTSVSAADVNEDGKTDLIVTFVSGSLLSETLLGNDDCTFQNTVATTTTTTTTTIP